MVRASFLSFALVLLLAIQVVPKPVDACALATDLVKSVPCGKIYPTIIIALAENAPKMFAMHKGATLDIPATVTFRFDAYQDGYGPASPTDPIKISFEYPRKPLWADIKVEPETVSVNVDDPTQLTPPSDPSNPSVPYSYTAKITIHAALTGQAVLRDGYDYAKLLVFAKSTENNLYQAAYGIKEIRVQPDGALHESDVAGLQDHFTAVPLPPMALHDASAKSGSTTVTLTAPKDPKWWESATYNVKVDPAPGGMMMLAMHDESGELEGLAGPVSAATGTASFNATMAKPGLHTVTVTLLPDAGTNTPPVTVPLDIIAGGNSTAQGFVYPKTYVAQQVVTVPTPIGSTNTGDPTIQWERDIPFYSFDTTQSVSATLTLMSPGPLPTGPGIANVQFSILDPDGNVLGTASVDPSRPVWTNRIGSVPVDGWYALRLRGSGLPALQQIDARIEVDYASAPQARNRADGVADITPALLGHGGRNLTLPTAGLGVWKASDLTPKLEKVAGMEFQTTVVDSKNELVYASGTRNATSSFTAPAAGTYRAFVLTEPTMGTTPFAPTVRAFTFTVGDNGTTTATTFPIADAATVPTSATSETLIAEYGIPIIDASAKGDIKLPSGARGELVGPDGKVVTQPTAPGLYTLRVFATNAGPATNVPVSYSMQLPAPITLAGLPAASAATKSAGAFPVPGFAVGLALLALGGVAVGVAVVRRR